MKYGKFILFAVYVLCSSSALVLMKKGGEGTSGKISAAGFSLDLKWLFVLGLCLYVVSFVLWTVIIGQFRLTYIMPVSYGAAFLVTAVLSHFFLREKVDLQSVLGLILIITGIAVCTVRFPVVK